MNRARLILQPVSVDFRFGNLSASIGECDTGGLRGVEYDRRGAIGGMDTVSSG
jgi:hypothetical protein